MRIKQGIYKDLPETQGPGTVYCSDGTIGAHIPLAQYISDETQPPWETLPTKEDYLASQRAATRTKFEITVLRDGKPEYIITQYVLPEDMANNERMNPHHLRHAVEDEESTITQKDIETAGVCEVVWKPVN